MDKETIEILTSFPILIPTALSLGFLWYHLEKKVREKHQNTFKNASTLEGEITEKSFTPYKFAQGLFDTSTPHQCNLGIKLSDGSKRVFSYHGKLAKEVYFFRSKIGENVSFKQGFRPYETKSTIR